MNKAPYIIQRLFVTACITVMLCHNGFSQFENHPVVQEFNMLNGKIFPSVIMEDTAGNLVNTDSLKGKTLYVEFWFTTCPPCIKQIPFSHSLQQFFAKDTSIVFLSICIDNIGQKSSWKQMIKEKEMTGVQLFYARNMPQQVNLLREFYVSYFPSCMLVNDSLEVVGYHAPLPSEKGWVHWSIQQASKGFSLAKSYIQMVQHITSYEKFMADNKEKFSTVFPK